MTSTADPIRCTWAGCRETATSSTPEGWDFCFAHSVADRELKAEPDGVISRPAGKPLPRAAAPLTVVPPTPASPIARLLEDASAHTVAKVRNLACRIETQLDQLRALISEHQAAEDARRAEQAEKEKARADVARLEAELAAAKAALKGQGGGFTAFDPSSDGSPRRRPYHTPRLPAVRPHLRARRRHGQPQEALHRQRSGMTSNSCGGTS